MFFQISVEAADSAGVKRLFANPPRDYSSGPLWVWNDMLTEEQIVATLRDLAGQKVKQVFVHRRRYRRDKLPVRNRHRKGSNCLYLDWHVEYVKTPETEEDAREKLEELANRLPKGSVVRGTASLWQACLVTRLRENQALDCCNLKKILIL